MEAATLRERLAMSSQRMCREMFLGHKRWLYGITFVLAAVLGVSLGSDVSHYWGVALNRTDSLPQTFFFLEKTVLPGRMDYIVFTTSKPSPYFPASQRFAKRVAGIGGDLVFMFDGQYAVRHATTGRVVVVGKAQDKDSHGRALKATSTGVIPPDHYFVYGDNPMSFDSRYAEMGFIPKDHVIAKAHPVL